MVENVSHGLAATTMKQKHMEVTESKDILRHTIRETRRKNNCHQIYSNQQGKGEVILLHYQVIPAASPNSIDVEGKSPTPKAQHSQMQKNMAERHAQSAFWGTALAHVYKKSPCHKRQSAN